METTVISNASSGRPEKNGNECVEPWFGNFFEVAKSNGRRLQHVDLPTSVKLANQGYEPSLE